MPWYSGLILAQQEEYFRYAKSDVVRPLNGKKILERICGSTILDKIVVGSINWASISSFFFGKEHKRLTAPWSLQICRASPMKWLGIRGNLLREVNYKKEMDSTIYLILGDLSPWCLYWGRTGFWADLIWCLGELAPQERGQAPWHR